MILSTSQASKKLSMVSAPRALPCETAMWLSKMMLLKAGP